MPLEPITTDEYFDAVEAAVRAVDGVATCQMDGLVEETTASPIVLVDVQEMASADELGSEVGWHTTVTVELVILVPRKDRRARRQAWTIAERVAMASRWATWGLPCGAAEVLGVERDDWSIYGEAFEVVRVEYAQPVAWAAPPPPPEPEITTVYVGRAPNVGPDHIDDYRQVVPCPEIEEEP